MSIEYGMSADFFRIAGYAAVRRLRRSRGVHPPCQQGATAQSRRFGPGECSRIGMLDLRPHLEVCSKSAASSCQLKIGKAWDPDRQYVVGAGAKGVPLPCISWE